MAEERGMRGKMEAGKRRGKWEEEGEGGEGEEVKEGRWGRGRRRVEGVDRIGRGGEVNQLRSYHLWLPVHILNADICNPMGT